MTERSGLILDAEGGVADHVRRLELPNWSFEVCASLGAARRVISSSQPVVGLLAFDPACPWPLRELEMLVADGGAEWIAVIGAGQLERPDLRKVVLRSCLDFHTLPLDRQRLMVTLGHAWGKATVCSLDEVCVPEPGCYGMTGQHPRMLALYRQIDKVVGVDAPVLICGESGTGKELVAHAIHQYSARRSGPFIAVNCGAIQSNLIQSELFGHERGAFTGAHQRKIGDIETAHGGVLFLDEIGDLPLDLQVSLLRFLQEKTFVRLGSTERRRVDVRVIAATNVDLHRAVSEGRFREDLYYRLNVLHLNVPPLRERVSDLAAIAQSVFANRERYQRSPQVRGFSIEALQAMHEHHWPGNVRELINRVQHAMIMSENRFITAADLGLVEPSGKSPTLDQVRSSVEREVIETTLHKCQNNVSEVARQLGVSRVTLYRMIERLKIVL